MVGGAAAGVLVEIPPDDVGAEISTLAGPGVEEQIVRKWLELAAEPVLERRSESHLGPTQDRRRQRASHRSLQEIFRREAAKLQPNGQPGRERLPG